MNWWTAIACIFLGKLQLGRIVKRLHDDTCVFNQWEIGDRGKLPSRAGLEEA
jgi:hypothetical protein